MTSEMKERRLQSHLLSTHSTLKPVEVVKKMGAMQAQDYEAALWAIGVRSSEDQTRETVESELQNGNIIRNWLLRGTIQVCASEDSSWLMEPGRESLLRTVRMRDEHLGLSQQIIEKSEKVLLEALSERSILTRSEVYELFEENGVPTSNNLGYHMLYRAAWAKLICFGPQKGRENTFVLYRGWVKEERKIQGNEMLKELAVRYFSGHGPATVKDFAWWAGIKVSVAKRAIENASSRLSEEQHAKNTYYDLVETDGGKEHLGAAILLPAFDEFILGYADRSPILGANSTQGYGKDESGRIVHSNGIFLPTIALNGKIIGTWNKKTDTRKVKIMLNLFKTSKDNNMSLIKDAAVRYGIFLGLDAEVIS